MSKNIRLSKEHGLNPSIDTCLICGSEIGIALFGDSYKDNTGHKSKAPMYTCTGNICDKCKAKIDEGYAFILEVTDNSTKEHIERTGRYACCKPEEGTDFTKIGFMRHSEYVNLVKDN